MKLYKYFIATALEKFIAESKDFLNLKRHSYNYTLVFNKRL